LFETGPRAAVLIDDERIVGVVWRLGYKSVHGARQKATGESARRWLPYADMTRNALLGHR
jgi:hypothetical protein